MQRGINLSTTEIPTFETKFKIGVGYSKEMLAEIVEHVIEFE